MAVEPGKRRPAAPSAGCGCAVVLALATSGCGGEADTPLPPPAAADPAPHERLVSVDGIDITFGDAAPWLEWYDRMYPVRSRRTKLRAILEQYLVPLRLAEREFAELRAEQHRRAQALCAVSGNVLELEQQAGLLVGKRATVAPGQVELPVARFLFDPLRTGSVSPPLPVPQGWMVVAAHELREGGVAIEDLADAFQVGFHTHERDAWDLWLEQHKRTLHRKVTYVHPDYHEALPTWLRNP